MYERRVTGCRHIINHHSIVLTLQEFDTVLSDFLTLLCPSNTALKSTPCRVCVRVYGSVNVCSIKLGPFVRFPFFCFSKFFPRPVLRVPQLCLHGRGRRWLVGTGC